MTINITSIVGIDPITMDEINIIEWVTTSPDNIVLFLQFHDLKNAKIFCVKKSYFIMPQLSNLFKLCKIDNNALLIHETYNDKRDYYKIGYYLGYNILIKYSALSVTINNIHKGSGSPFIGLNVSLDKSLFINKELLKLENLELASLQNKSFKKNIPLKEDIYFRDLYKKALHNYSFQWDQAMNLFLRQGVKYFESSAFKTRFKRYGNTIDEAITNIKKKISHIDQVFLRFAPRHEVSSAKYYRGMKSPYMVSTNRPFNQIGDSILIRNFISITKSLAVAENFTGGMDSVIYVFHLDNGVPFINMVNTTQFKSEREILLPRNLRLTITSEDKDYNIHVTVSMVDEGKNFKLPNKCKSYLSIDNLEYLSLPSQFNFSFKKYREFITKSIKNDVVLAPEIDKPQKLKRCPNGTKRNKKTGNCESKTKPTSPINHSAKTVYNSSASEGPAPKPNSLGQHQPSSNKETKKKKLPKCPNGTRRNKKTGQCEPYPKK